MSENENKTPTYKDVEWNDYVLSKLDEKEKMDGQPVTEGLRRLVELLIGEIIEVDTAIIQSPSPENLHKCVVKSRICIYLHEKDRPFNRVYFTGCADADTRNCDSPYNAFTTAMAETRALGRAYRQALRIRTNTAEELSQNAESSADYINNDIKISGTQIKGIDTLCSKLDISVVAFMNSGELKYNKINEVSLNKGIQMLKILNEYKQGSRQIPENIKRYDNTWQDKFK